MIGCSNLYKRKTLGVNASGYLAASVSGCQASDLVYKTRKSVEFYI
jgi:hypothetical protein